MVAHGGTSVAGSFIHDHDGHRNGSKAIKRRLRETYRTLDPVALLAEMRRCQEVLGQRIVARGIKFARRRPAQEISPVPTEVGEFARTLGATPLDTADAASNEPRATHSTSNFRRGCDRCHADGVETLGATHVQQ